MYAIPLPQSIVRCSLCINVNVNASAPSDRSFPSDTALIKLLLVSRRLLCLLFLIRSGGLMGWPGCRPWSIALYVGRNARPLWESSCFASCCISGAIPDALLPVEGEEDMPLCRSPDGGPPHSNPDNFAYISPFNYNRSE